MKPAGEIRTENLKAIINAAGLSQEEFGSKIGGEKPISAQQINQWLNNTINSTTGKPRYIGSASCRKIERIFGYPENWMDQDHGSEPVETASHYLKKNDEAVFEVLDVKAACGNGFINIDHPEVIKRIVLPVDRAMELIGTANRNGRIQVIIAAKDSMQPTINPNDLLFVDTNIQEYKGQGVYVLLHGGELICKRLQLIGKHLTVLSDNKNYESWRWDERPDETLIVGKVIRALPMDFKIFGN